MIGPRNGFSPQIGTLISMMTWMRSVVLGTVKDLTKAQLDFLFDENANSIGALLLHLAATERYYQISTFNWKTSFKGDGKVNWEAAMELGDRGRMEIKGQALEYYLQILQETRNATIREFRNRDDRWLARVDPTGFQNLPTNNYCKWFHVCEHESNHNGQIKWLKSRLKH
ncbi:MAG TPA: DinB family protein [Sphingobacteriaceae bacterium]